MAGAHGAHLTEVQRLVNDVVAAGLPLDTVWVSHLSAAELATLRATYPDYTFRPRVGTDLWLGDRGVAATVAGSGVSAEDVVRRQEAAAPSGRFTRPEEVADLVVFLASTRAANITGSDFVIDGGLITTL